MRSIASICLLVAVSCSGGAPGHARPNVLLISLDSVRRDLVSAYGHRSAFAPDVSSSPTIDRLAAEGVLFERAYSTTSWTLPAHASLLAGKPEIVHGVELDVMSLSADHPTLAEVLREAGYRTAGFYSGPYLDPRFGFGRGFERYEACYGPELAAAAERARRLAGDARPEAAAERMEAGAAVEDLSHRDRSSARVSDAVLAELAVARADGRPWMVFAHYFDPHYDFVPPPPFDARFDPAYEGAEDGHDLITNEAISVWRPTKEDPRARERKISERDLDHVRALYAGELAWTDQELGRVVDALRASGELENTLVVVVADHGDEFFEHGNLGHRKSVFEEVVRIPLIARFPSELPAGERVSAIASIHDVYATVLELADVAPPRETISRSLVPLAAGEASGADRWAFGRLVNLVPMPHKSGTTALDTWVEEYFVQGAIKIRRTRRWIGPGPRSAKEMVPEFTALAEAMRREDHALEWIDLETHPGEELAAYSRGFDDPRAAAALARFRSEYERLADLHRAPATIERSAAEDSMLAGLGYAGEETESVGPDASLFDALTLPPPGDD